ncbi:hypothetical protein PENSPDRAFT_654756 [Peniophora sp. CONT]|nr:hypothetical protein PENSPDRAFT_654756 [Peniophora sp. CONT]
MIPIFASVSTSTSYTLAMQLLSLVLQNACGNTAYALAFKQESSDRRIASAPPPTKLWFRSGISPVVAMLLPSYDLACIIWFLMNKCPSKAQNDTYLAK